MEGQGNAFKVGVAVVTAAIILTAGLAFVQSEVIHRGRTYYVMVRFDDALGISKGVIVKRAGTDIGEVEDFGLSEDGMHTEAKIRIKDDVELYTSDVFVITQESLLGGSFIAVYRLDESSREIASEGEILYGRRQGGFNEIIEQTSHLIKTVEDMLGPDSLGGAIKDITARLERTLLKVEGLIDDSHAILVENKGYISTSMRNVSAISRNFLTVSQNLEETSLAVKELATDPKNAEAIAAIMADMQETSATVNHLMAEVDALISDPVVQQDIKDSVRLTKETLEEAKTTMVRFQTTLDSVDGLMGEAGGAMDLAKSKMAELEAFGDAIEVRTSLVIRAVDQNNDNSLGNSDYTVGDINAALAFEDTYITLGADNIGQGAKTNFMIGYGSLHGLSFRGGVYRGELGFGGAYYLPGGGGAEITWYDTENPKLNSFGYFPIGKKLKLVVGAEDIVNDAKPSVGLGFEL